MEQHPRAQQLDLLVLIEATPDRLREIDGIGPVRAASILAAWAEQKAVREIMVFLHSHGVGTARAVRIFKTSDAIQVMTENPYRLARDIRGIGFKTADAIAMKLGIEKIAMVRVRAGISYALTEAMDEGHCGLPTSRGCGPAHGVEMRPLLVMTIQRLPQRTIDSTLPTCGTVSPRAALQTPSGPSRTAVAPKTSRTVQPSMVSGLVSGNGIWLDANLERRPKSDATGSDGAVLCCATAEALMASGRCAALLV
jgi:Helix-hairpin-helix containing domain